MRTTEQRTPDYEAGVVDVLDALADTFAVNPQLRMTGGGAAQLVREMREDCRRGFEAGR